LASVFDVLKSLKNIWKNAEAYQIVIKMSIASKRTSLSNQEVNGVKSA
jgi:hypothetical protein